MKRPHEDLNWRSQVTGDPLWPLTELFEPLEDVQFWIKDRENRYVHVNRAFLLNYALDEAAQIIGETDYHLSPAFLADQFWLDDERVLAGHRVVNRIELVGDADQTTFWNVTNKVPFRDARGRVVGTAGTTRRLGPADQSVAGADGFEAVMARIRDHYREQLSNRELAALAGLSVRGFERKFQQHFQVPPSNTSASCASGWPAESWCLPKRHSPKLLSRVGLRTKATLTTSSAARWAGRPEGIGSTTGGPGIKSACRQNSAVRAQDGPRSA